MKKNICLFIVAGIVLYACSPKVPAPESKFFNKQKR